MDYPSRILIVDDEELILDNLKSMLHRHGYVCDTVSSGREALDRMAGASYPVVVLDIVMPDMDGFEVIDRIQSKWPRTAIILITGYASVESSVAALRKRVYDYLTKPFSYDEVIRTVDRAVEYHHLLMERDEALKALTDSEIEMRTVFEEAPDAIFIADPETGRIIDVNRSGCFLLRKRANEIIGIHFSELHPEEMRGPLEEMFRHHCRLTAANGTTAPYENFVLRSDGVRVPVEIVARSLKLSGRMMVQGIFRDISRRKAAEERLADTRKLFETVLEAIPSPIFYKDTDGRYMGCNRAFEEIIGKPKKAIVGRTVYDVASRDLADVFFQKDLDLIRNPGVQQYEGVVSDADGRLREVVFYKSTFTNGREAVAGIVGVMLDVTDLRRMENALADTERRYRNLFESAPIGVFYSTTNGKFIEVNPHLARMLGYDSPTEMKTAVNRTSISEALYVEPPRRCEIVSEVIKAGGWQRYENRYRRKDGSILIASLLLRRVRTEDKEPAHLEGFVTDITAQKAMDDRMRRALAEKDVLLREIHHRVKNNLAVIVSLVDMQTDNLADPRIISSFREFRERVHAMALVHEDLYKSESLARIDAKGYLETLGRDLFEVFEARDIRLCLSVSSISLGTDTAVPCGLIVNELVINALKYAFPAGRPNEDSSSETCEIRIGLTSAAENLILTVSDNGVCLPADMDWRQASSLGLRLVNILARQLKGTLTLAAEAGTTFTLTFAPAESPVDSGKYETA